MGSFATTTTTTTTRRKRGKRGKSHEKNMKCGNVNSRYLTGKRLSSRSCCSSPLRSTRRQQHQQLKQILSGQKQGRRSLATTRAVGIDLGTTNSAVAVTKDGRTFVIPGPDGTNVTRSVVSYNDEGGVIVGESAKLFSLISKASTFSSIKRLIGRRISELESKMYELLPYYIMSNEPAAAAIAYGIGKENEEFLL